MCILYIAFFLKKILKMRKFAISNPIPFGMKKEEFITYKTRSKLEMMAVFMVCILLIGGITFFLGWGRGEYGIVPERKIEQLKMMHGTFFDEVQGGGRAPYHVFGLRDEKTGKVILQAFTEFCGNNDSLSYYSHRPANIWFAYGPGSQNKWMYQLEVNGRMVCDLDTANRRVKIKNDKLYENYLWASGIFLLILLPLVVDLMEYYMEKVYSKKFD